MSLSVKSFIKHFVENVEKAPYRVTKMDSNQVSAIALKTAAVVLGAAIFAAVATFAAPVVVAIVTVSMIALAAGGLACTYFITDEYERMNSVKGMVNDLGSEVKDNLEAGWKAFIGKK